MLKLWAKLKSRWGIENNFQAALVFLSFALSGPSTLWFHRKIDLLLGITDDSSFWIKFAIFIVIVYPIFNLFLYLYSSLFGQNKFAKSFILNKIKLLSKLKKLV